MRKGLIGGLTVTVLLVLAAVRVGDLWQTREVRLLAAEDRAANLALILSEYLSGTFASGDAALRQLVLHSRRVGGPAAPESEWTPSLASARAGIPAMGSISIIDRHAIIRHSTRRDIVGQSRADNFGSREVLNAADDRLVIGNPIRAVAPPFSLLIPMARPLRNEAGTIEGAVVASFIPRELRSFFQSVDVGQDGTIWVFHPDGTLLFREPSEADAMGENAANNPVFAAASRASAGTLRAPLAPGGREMIAGFRVSERPRLITAVAFNRAEVLANWRAEATWFAWVFSGAALLVAVTLMGLFRQIDAKAVAERELARARQLEAERLRDANERLEATLQREQAARRDAEAASALKDQFLMTISHELRTPLTAIAGWSRLLADGMVGESRRQTAVESIVRNAQAQTRLIEDLLDVSAIMAGKLRLDVRPVEVSEVIAAAVESVRGTAEAKLIAIETSLDGEVTIEADPERLQQVFSNLLSNAVKFTPGGGRIRVDLSRDDAHVDIVVSDTGIGIAPEFLPHVFDQFRQADSSATRRHGGLGLGLAIVQSVVEMHGGTVRAASDGPDRGATFTIRLPAIRSAA